MTAGMTIKKGKVVLRHCATGFLLPAFAGTCFAGMTEKDDHLIGNAIRDLEGLARQEAVERGEDAGSAAGDVGVGGAVH